MLCCGVFRSKEIQYLTSNEDFIERTLYAGICPQCENFVIELHQRKLNGDLTILTVKRNKALKLYEKLKPEFIHKKEAYKTGSKSNLAFKYGENKEIKNSKGSVIEYRQYAVDFNGTKDLILAKKV